MSCVSTEDMHGKGMVQGSGEPGRSSSSSVHIELDLPSEYSEVGGGELGNKTG